MTRIKIDLPAHFSFLTDIPIRITDLNYGGHVGNDVLLSIIHEARMQFLGHYGLTELDFAGTSLIMSGVGIEFRNEIFYGDVIRAAVAVGPISKIGFDIFYRLERMTGERPALLAVARTGMVCYNYQLQKIVRVPDQALLKLAGA